MNKWPDYVYAAANTMGYDYEQPSDIAAINDFAMRWGGFNTNGLIRAVRAAEGDERIFAFLLLESSGNPHAREVVAPYLTSDDPLTRWYSALYLGKVKDARALPVLCTMLTEYLPSPEDYQVAWEQQWRFEQARAGAAYALGRLGQPVCVPALRHALLLILRIEEAQIISPNSSVSDRWLYESVMTALRLYEDTIVYALGRLMAFGVLAGLPDHDGRMALWRVHLVMGSLHDEGFHVAHLTHFNDELPLYARVTSLLADVFGLSASEQVQHLASYETTRLVQVSHFHSAEAMEWTENVPADSDLDP